MTDKICVTCFYSKGHFTVKNKLECRRYPPQAIESNDVFPLVDPGMWCGEFLEKQPIVKTKQQEDS